MVRELRLLPVFVLVLLCLFPLFRTREEVEMVGRVGRVDCFLGGLSGLRDRAGMVVGVGALEGLVSREKLLVRGTVVDVIVPMSGLALAVEPRRGPGSVSLIWWCWCGWGCGCGCGCCGCCCW